MVVEAGRTFLAQNFTHVFDVSCASKPFEKFGDGSAAHVCKTFIFFHRSQDFLHVIFSTPLHPLFLLPRPLSSSSTVPVPSQALDLLHTKHFTSAFVGTSSAEQSDRLRVGCCALCSTHTNGSARKLHVME